MQTNACNKTGFNCSLQELTFQIEYTLSDGSNETKTITVAANATDDVDVVLNDVFQSESIGSVGRLSSTVLDITFDASISEVVIRVPKDCEDRETEVILLSNVLECPDVQKPIILYNTYGLKDTVLTKPQFEIAVGQMRIDATYHATGEAMLTSALNGILEVLVDLTGSINGTSTLDLGGESYLKPAGEWIIDATLLNETFFTSTTDFNGRFDSNVSALSPFEAKGQDEIGTGSFSNFSIDFNASGVDYPDFPLEIDVIGDVRKLTFGAWLWEEMCS